MSRRLIKTIVLAGEIFTAGTLIPDDIADGVTAKGVFAEDPESAEPVVPEPVVPAPVDPAEGIGDPKSQDPDAGEGSTEPAASAGDTAAVDKGDSYEPANEAASTETEGADEAPKSRTRSRKA